MSGSDESANVYVAEIFAGRGRLWDRKPDIERATGLMTIIKNLKSEQFSFQAAAFNNRGDKFATVDQKGSIYLYHVVGNRFALVARVGRAGTAISFAPGPRSDVLAVAFDDGSIRLYSTEHKYELLATLSDGHRRPVRRFAWHRSGQSVLTTSTDSVCLWETRANFDTSAAAVAAGAHSKGKSSSAKNGGWKKIRTLSIAAAQQTAAALVSQVTQASFLPSEEKIMTCLSDNSLHCWDRQSFRLLYTLRPPAMPNKRKLQLNCFAVTDNARYLLGGGGSRYLMLWQLTDQVFLRLLALPPSVHAVSRIEFLPETEIAVLLCDDGHLRFVNPLNRRVLLDISRLPQRVEEFSFGSDGQYCVCRMSDGSAHLLDLVAALTHQNQQAATRRAAGYDDDSIFEHLKMVPLQGAGASSLDDVDSVEIGSHVEDLTAPLPSSYGPGKLFSQASSSASSKTTKKVTKLSSRPALSSAFAENADFGSSEPDQESKAASTASSSSFGKVFDGELDADVKMPSKSSESRFSDSELASAKKLLDVDKLRKLLRAYGEFPARYRLMIWKYLLRVPENNQAFENLLGRGVHSAWRSLAEQYPIPDRKLFRRLQRVLSALSYWSPIFAEVAYLPGLVFPFVRMFENEEEVVAFELVQTLLLNWSRRWFELFPHAPSTLLRQCEVVMAHHDPALLQHLREQGFVFDQFFWPVLRSLMTELLNKQEWLRAFDHVFCNDTPFLSYLILAYLIYFRTSLLRVTNVDDFHFFLHHQNAVNLNEVLVLAYKMQNETPQQIQIESDSWISIPRGQYPIFNYYPKFVVDFQLKERERAAEEEKQLEQRKQIMQELQHRSEKLIEEQQAWASRQESVLKAEEERRARWLLEEEERKKKQMLIDQETTYRRLQQLGLMEQAIQRSWQEREKLRESEWNRLEDEMRHKRERDEYELKRRTEEEALLNLEFQMNQRITALQQQKDDEAAVKLLRQQYTGAQEQFESQKNLQVEKWRIEDEERRIRLQIQREQAEKLRSFNEGIRDQRRLDQQRTLQLLQYELDMTAVERERRLRHLTQDEIERSESDLLQRKQREEILAREERAEQEALLSEERRWRQQQARAREQRIDEEKRRGEIEAEQRAERLRELERAQRRREAEELLRQRHEEELAKQLVEEKDVQQLLRQMEEDRKRDRRLEIDLLLQEQQTKERLAFQRVLKEAEVKIIEEERKKFTELRSEMANRMREEEERLLKRHADIMARLMVERERKLWRMRQQWASGVQSEEMSKLEADYAQHEQHMAQMQQTLAAEQEAHRSLVNNLDANMSKVGDYLQRSESGLATSASQNLDNVSSSSSTSSSALQSGNLMSSFGAASNVSGSSQSQSSSSSASASLFGGSRAVRFDVPSTPSASTFTTSTSTKPLSTVPSASSSNSSSDIINEAQRLLKMHRERLSLVANQATTSSSSPSMQSASSSSTLSSIDLFSSSSTTPMLSAVGTRLPSFPLPGSNLTQADTTITSSQGLPMAYQVFVSPGGSSSENSNPGNLSALPSTSANSMFPIASTAVPITPIYAPLVYAQPPLVQSSSAPGPASSSSSSSASLPIAAVPMMPPMSTSSTQ